MFKNISKPIDDERTLAKCYAELALVTKEKGEYDESLRYHRKSMEIFQRIAEPLSVADGHLDIAEIYKVKGELRQAMTEYEKGLTLYEDTLLESHDSGVDLDFSENSHHRLLIESEENFSTCSIFDEQNVHDDFLDEIFPGEKENFLFNDQNQSEKKLIRRFSSNFYLICAATIIFIAVFLCLNPNSLTKFFFDRSTISTDDDLTRQIQKYSTWQNERFNSLSKSMKRTIEQISRKSNARKKISIEEFQRILDKLDLKIVLAPR